MWLLDLRRQSALDETLLPLSPYLVPNETLTVQVFLLNFLIHQCQASVLQSLNRVCLVVLFERGMKKQELMTRVLWVFVK